MSFLGMESLSKFSSSGRKVAWERWRWARVSAFLERILFLGDGEREEEEEVVCERGIGGRVGEGVGSVEADEADVTRRGSGRNERCGVMRGVLASVASPRSLFRREFRLTFT